jgi:hypothetical protein
MLLDTAKNLAGYTQYIFSTGYTNPAKRQILLDDCLAILPQSEKLVPYILLLTIVVIGLRKHYTKTGVGAVLS